VLNAASRRSEKCISCFGQGTLRKSLHTPRQRWECSINKYRVWRGKCKCVCWIELAEDAVWWYTLWMWGWSFRFHQRQGISQPTEWL